MVKVNAYYFGTAADVASPEIVASGWPTVTITSGKLRRYFSWRNLTDAGLVWRGWRTALAALKQLQPDVVFVKGGYVSVPVALAARRLHIPVITHESDAVIGLANRLISRAARVVAVTYPVDSYALGARRKLRWTGPIIRPELAGDVWRSRPKPKQIMILGGSQGAKRINELIFDSLDELTKLVTVRHQTGGAGIEEARQRRQALSVGQRRRYQPVDFISDPAELVAELAKSDLVISRGGSTVFELALLGMPAILIPLSTSAGGHQSANAAHFKRHRAAVVLDETKVTAAELTTVIKRLLASSSRRAALSRQMRQLAVEDGAANVARLILEHADR